MPYRNPVERALPIDVTVGLGGPRVLPAGTTGIYGISLQSLTNVDTPYVYFEFGAPYIGVNAQIFGLPFVTFNSNVRGEADAQRDDVPWASFDSEVNTAGYMLAPGYALDVTADGYVGMSFTVLTYAGLKEMLERDPATLRTTLLDALPKPYFDVDPATGMSKFDILMSGLEEHMATAEEILDECDPLYIPFRFNVMAAATPLTRAEFVERQTDDALRLREAILLDGTANAVLVNLAADPDAGRRAISRHWKSRACSGPRARRRRSG